MSKNFKGILGKTAIYLIILMYTYAVFIIFKDFTGFKVKLFKSALIENNWIPYLSILIPSIMILLAALLMLEIKLRQTLWSSLFVLCAFTIYLFAINEYSLFTGCSCGGVFEQLSYSQHLVLNVIFIGINVFALLYFSRKKVQET